MEDFFTIIRIFFVFYHLCKKKKQFNYHCTHGRHIGHYFPVDEKFVSENTKEYKENEENSGAELCQKKTKMKWASSFQG
jgi:hypothetical protein